ncbi:hypothetical protein OG900_05515 [Streptomyces sp. NBC_00433]
MRAWAAFDTRGECPDHAFDTALHAAHAESDAALGAHVPAFWSITAYNTGRPADAEAMVTAALAAARGRTADRVMAMLLSRRARALAVMPCEVGDAGGGCSAAQGGVSAAMVIVGPLWRRFASLGF